MGPTPLRIDPTTHRTTSERPYHGSYISLPSPPPHEESTRRPIAPRENALTTELHLAPPPPSMKNRPDDPSHHERMPLPRSYISLSPPPPPQEESTRRHIAPRANALTTGATSRSNRRDALLPSWWIMIFFVNVKMTTVSKSVSDSHCVVGHNERGTTWFAFDS